MNVEDSYGEELAAGDRSPAAYRASAVASRGRRHPEPECRTRSPFQRDRDRILHSTAFRRLTYKTQVFIFHEGDHFRTRLTHTLEVAQIARTIARQLRLDEDLAEALALAHDLGHPPFGHAGERALNRAMAEDGGFDHNAQSLRVVTMLERKYAGFDGLNLTWETLEGLAKHNGPIEDAGSPVAKVAAGLAAWQPLDLATWASAEAQVAAISDDIAYLTHDLDDGLRAGLIELTSIGDVPLAGRMAVRIDQASSAHAGRQIYEVTRSMITAMIGDVVAESRTRLRHRAPHSPGDIRNATGAVVGFSGEFAREISDLRAQLFDRVYRSGKVMKSVQAAEQIVTDLYQRYREALGELPDPWRRAAEALEPRRRARVVADFVAGQTDRYAVGEHRRLFDRTPDLR